jgi:DNA (cytosine-5)-methyltransferase 1
MLTHFSLFTGVGGLDLSAEWAGFQTVGQCEWADYPTKVLEKHWPNVPRWRDIRSVTADSFYDKTGLRTVDIISGGFPCQPFSFAGKRKGEEDDRFLWPEMLRVIQELQSSWVVGENVAGIVNMALDQVLSDLENEGYEVQTFIIPACGVEAPHKRERVFIVGWNTNSGNVGEVGKIQKRQGTESGRVCENVANTNKSRCKELELQRESSKRKMFRGISEERSTIGGNWSIEPGVGRAANGISNRVDRLECLGNAVVPQQAYPIFQAIADIENSIKDWD